MVTYDDYLKYLKHTANGELGKRIFPLENEMKSLSVELTKLSQKNNELSSELSKLQHESAELSEREREVIEVKKANKLKLQQREEAMWGLFFGIIIAVGGGIAGRFLASLFSAHLFQHWYDYAALAAIVCGTLSLIIGAITTRNPKESLGAGCGGAIIFGLIASILGALLSTHFMVFTVFFAIFGVIIIIISLVNFLK